MQDPDENRAWQFQQFVSNLLIRELSDQEYNQVLPLANQLNQAENHYINLYRAIQIIAPHRISQTFDLGQLAAIFERINGPYDGTTGQGRQNQQPPQTSPAPHNATHLIYWSQHDLDDMFNKTA